MSIERDIKKVKQFKRPFTLKLESIQIKQKDSHGFYEYFLKH